MRAFTYLCDAFGGLENISCISLPSLVFVGRTLMWGARKRLARIKRLHRRAGGWFPCREVQGETSGGGQAAAHSIRRTRGAGRKPHVGGSLVHSCRGTTELGQQFAEATEDIRMKRLPTTEEAAAFRSLLNEVAKKASGPLFNSLPYLGLPASPSSFCSLKKGQPKTERSTHLSLGFSVLFVCFFLIPTQDRFYLF